MRLVDRVPVLGGNEEVLQPFLERAATWAAALTYRDIPKPVRRAAKAQRASTVGAAVWTGSHPIRDAIAETVESQYAAGAATLLTGDSIQPEGAAYGNAALSMALAFDDAILGGPTGHSSVFVPLAYAEAADVDGERVLVAHVAANEVAARLACAAGIEHLHEQSTAYIHAVAAVVGRAVIENDDAATIADALGIALLQPPWPLEAPLLGSAAKIWSASEPIRDGLAALDAARSGIAGRPELVEAEGGFLETFADVSHPAFLGKLGERWHTRAMTIKAQPGSASIAGPIEAALEARGHLHRGHTAIDRIDVYAARFTVAATDRAAPYLDGPDTPVGALSTTVPFNVAAALVDGEHTPAQLGERVTDPDIWRLAERVSVHHDPTFTVAALASSSYGEATLGHSGLRSVGTAARSLGPGAALRHLPTLVRLARERSIPCDLSGIANRVGATVEIATAAGRTVGGTIEHPAGFAGRPLAEIRAIARRKCRTGLQAGGLRESEARRWVEELLAIEDAGAVSLPSLPNPASQV